MHVAHQKVISTVDALVIIERNGGYLTPGYRRSLYTDKICCFYYFDKIRSWTPETFVARLKEDFPHLERIVIGYDFAFGKGKEGSARTLAALFDKEVTVVDEVTINGIAVHSRTIKAYLREGNITMANRLLGRYYAIEGSVVSGQGLGRTELVPTINLHVPHYQLPLEGVYATRTKIAEQWMPSVSFLGHRITTDGTFAVESHVLHEDIGEMIAEVQLEFRAFIRGNRKFDSLHVLKEQINDDIRQAEMLLEVP